MLNEIARGAFRAMIFCHIAARYPVYALLRLDAAGYGRLLPAFQQGNGPTNARGHERPRPRTRLSYCSQISLLFELPRDGGPTRLLAPKRPGTIAALVATKTRLAWLLDVGETRTEVEVLRL